jgi:hypothetical protein
VAKTHDPFVGLVRFAVEVHFFTATGAFGLGHLLSAWICPEPVWPKLAVGPSASLYIFTAVADAFETMFTDRLEGRQRFRFGFHKNSFKERAGRPIGQSPLGNAKHFSRQLSSREDHPFPDGGDRLFVFDLLLFDLAFFDLKLFPLLLKLPDSLFEVFLAFIPIGRDRQIIPLVFQLRNLATDCPLTPIQLDLEPVLCGEGRFKNL